MDQIKNYASLILKNKDYFNGFVVFLLQKYNFKANEEHLRKKLHKFLDGYHLIDSAKSAQRLVRGKYIPFDEDKETWAWIGGAEIGWFGKDVIERKCGLL
ncbi:MAG: hypothetical protein L0Y61_02830 [Epsilonproteobacteria bacterium]|nr:hypothetical protein [Campylobacterota bacterium]